MYLSITITSLVQLFFIIFTLFFSIFINEISAAAGYCYQCNSNNPKCGMDVNVELKRDATPCNGQCYTRLNQDAGNTIYRGCSWEHGFMSPQPPNTLVVKGNSVWIFCDTAYCNYEATGLLNNVCYQPICNFLTFPDDCQLPNADITCGRFCGNQLCGSAPVPRLPTRQRQPTRSHNRVRSQKKVRSRNRIRSHKRVRSHKHNRKG